VKLSRKEFLGLVAGTAVLAGAGKLVQAVQPAGEAARQEGEGRGRRWGMVIDLELCSREEGCRLCSQACHKAHNVPEIPNRAHQVKWIWHEPADRVFPFQQSAYSRPLGVEPLPVLCNHCAHPSCARVCPTGATWKREDGVVMMDYHRCIGCRYCMAACPYGSRSFNFEDPRPYLAAVNPEFPTRCAGVVEKCNFCEERLANGGVPACVEGCHHKAMVFGDLNDPHSAVRQLLKSRFALQRLPELGNGPAIFYLV